MDYKIYQLGDGTWDLFMEETEYGLDFVMLGETSDTWQELVAQRVVYAVMTWLGESAYDISQGFPWEDGVFGRQPIEGIAALLYQHIEAVEGVDGMDEAPTLALDNTTRRLSIDVVVKSKQFQIPVSVIVQGPT